LVLISLYAAGFLAAAVTARVHRGRTSPLPPPPAPPLRLPSATGVAARAGTELVAFLSRSGPLLLLGVLAVWALIHLPWGLAPGAPGTYADGLARALAPVLDPIGIEHGLTLALLFGLIAKEVVLGGLAVVYGAGGTGLTGVVAAHLDGLHAYSFLLFVLIYTPCLSTVAAVRRASASWRETLLSVVWPLGLAWGVCFVFYQGAQLVRGYLL
jgi:ferrous iron transport protein B